MRTLSKRSALCVALACVTVLLGIPACESASTDTAAPDAGLTAQESAVRDAAQAMLQRGDGATVTVLDDGGAPFLKLTCDDGGITANLPLDWVNDPELVAARELFADQGAAGDDLPGRNTTTLFPSLTVSLGDDPEHAARFTADLLEQAFALAPQEELVFETEDD